MPENSTQNEAYFSLPNGEMGSSLKEMEVWGITGLKGSGKSEAAQYLRQLSYPILDVDQISKQVVDRNTDLGREGFEKIFRLFGSSVLDSQGNLDKRALMKRLLLNPTDKERLEAAVDPLVIKVFEKSMKDWKSSGTPLAFVEGSRLAEAGFHKILAGLIQMTASIDKRVSRIAKRDSMGKLEVEMIMQGQDEELMRRLRRLEWKNDGKVKDLQKTIDLFVAERLKTIRA